MSNKIFYCLNHIDCLRLYIKSSDSIRNNIMGIEGQVSLSLDGFANVLDEKWNFKGRSREVLKTQ